MSHFFYRDKSGLHQKLFVCLFICRTTRAINLEVVTNLSAVSFLQCLRHLLATHGAPRTILSDNHKTFLTRDKFLWDIQKDLDVIAHLQSHHTEWRTQVPQAPLMGGHFERLVRTIMTCLAVSISRKLFTFEKFTIVVKEVEMIVNNRLLTYQSMDSRDMPLTLSHLIQRWDILLFPPLHNPPDEKYDHQDAEQLCHHYNMLSNALQLFQKMLI